MEDLEVFDGNTVPVCVGEEAPRKRLLTSPPNELIGTGDSTDAKRAKLENDVRSSLISDGTKADDAILVVTDEFRVPHCEAGKSNPAADRLDSSARPHASQPLRQGAGRRQQQSSPGGSRHQPVTIPPSDPAQLRAAIRKQVEYYFSDENMLTDAFFQEKIAENTEGWLAVSHILSCRNIKRLNVTSSQEIADALAESELETKKDNTNSFWVRRTTPLPPLDVAARAKKGALPRGKKQEKIEDMTTFHDAGCIVRAAGVPEEATWQAVKDALKARLPDKVVVKFVSQIQQDSSCYIWMLHFEKDVEMFETGLKIEVSGCEVEIQMLTDPIEGYKVVHSIFPSPVIKQRDQLLKKLARNVRKSGQHKIKIGETTFSSVAAMRKQIVSYIHKAKLDEIIESSDPMFKVVIALLKYHPSAESKMRQFASLKVGESGPDSRGKRSRCFFVIRDNGENEDFSIVKCIAEMEKNPPYFNDKTLLPDVSKYQTEMAQSESQSEIQSEVHDEDCAAKSLNEVEKSNEQPEAAGA